MHDEPGEKFFVEPKTAEAQERIGAYLAERHLADSNWHKGVEDTDGKKHDGWDIADLRTMRLIRSMERQDTRVIVGYWKRGTTAGTRLTSANFIVITAPAFKTRRTAKYKRAVKKIPKRATAK